MPDGLRSLQRKALDRNEPGRIDVTVLPTVSRERIRGTGVGCGLVDLRSEQPALDRRPYRGDQQAVITPRERPGDRSGREAT